LTGHIGAWELSVYAHSIYGYPMAFLKRSVDNPLVERWPKADARASAIAALTRKARCAT
jgi:lauroyl/myristoyl acyltransferase